MIRKHITKKALLFLTFITMLICPVQVIVAAIPSANKFWTSKYNYSQYRDYYLFEQGGGNFTNMTEQLPYTSLNYAAYAHTTLDDMTKKTKENLGLQTLEPKQVCIVVPVNNSPTNNTYKSYYGEVKLVNGSWIANGTPEQQEYENKTIAEMCPGGFWTIREFYTRNALAASGKSEQLGVTAEEKNNNPNALNDNKDINLFIKYKAERVCSRSKCTEVNVKGECIEDETGEITRYIKHYGNISYDKGGVTTESKNAFNNFASTRKDFCSTTADCTIYGLSGSEIPCGAIGNPNNISGLANVVGYEKDHPEISNNKTITTTTTIVTEPSIKVYVTPMSEYVRPAIVREVSGSNVTYKTMNLGKIWYNSTKIVELTSDNKIKSANGSYSNGKYYEYVPYEAPRSEFGTKDTGCSENFKITINNTELTIHRDYVDTWLPDAGRCATLDTEISRALYPTYSNGTAYYRDTTGYAVPILVAKEITDSNWKKEINNYNSAEVKIETNTSTTYKQQVTLTDVVVKKAAGQKNKRVFGIGRKIVYSDYKTKFDHNTPVADATYSAGQMPAVIVAQVRAICTDPNPTKKQLTCNKFETIFEHGYDDEDKTCAVFVASGRNEKNNVKAIFKQKGILKVNLNNRYIKSGESFTIAATYEDKIKVEYIDNSKHGTMDDSMMEGLKDYIRNAEIFKKFTYSLKYEGKSGIDLGGEWKYYVNGIECKNATDAANKLANALIVNSYTDKSATLKLEYQLYDAWSNTNENNYIKINGKTISNYAGVAHIYNNTNPSNAENEWNYEGKRFYTRLDSKTKTYDIIWNIHGLSAIDYNYTGKSANNYFWEIDYNCNINCHQEFYDGGLVTGKGNPGFKFSYREIDSQNPFPLIPGKIQASYSMKQRYIGIDANWITWATAIGAKNGITGTLQVPQNGLTKINTRINNRYSSETNKKADYIVVVDKKAINKVKKYNNLNNYYEASGYTKITKNGETDSQYSKFLGSTLGQKTNGYGVTVWRNDKMVVNPVGTCGTNRGESIVTGSCFCMLADSSGNCIYNRNFTLD